MKISIKPLTRLQKSLAITRKSNPNMKVLDLEMLWSPYLLYLKYVGLHILNGQNLKHSRFWRNPFTLYSCIIILETVYAVIMTRFRVVSLNEYNVKFDHRTVSFVLSTIWPIAQLCCLLTFFMASWSRSGFARVFYLFSQLKLDHLQAGRLTSRIRWMARCIFGLFLLLSVIQLAVYYQLALQLYFPEGEFYWSHSVFLIVIRGINVNISVHIVGFIVMASLTLVLVFQEVNNILCFDINLLDSEKGMTRLHANLTWFNHCFCSATRLTSAFDNVFSWVIGLYFLSDMFQAIFNTFLLIYRHENRYLVYYLPVDVYWLVESVLWVLMITISTSMVNCQAHASYWVLCAARLENLSATEQMMVSTLQNRLSNTSIGLSAFGFQVMRKQVLYSVVSFYLTYVFLAIQFNNEST